jgi:hypothetical protein
MSQVHGTAGVEFGLTPEDGGILQSLEIGSRAENTTARNEEGDTSVIALYDIGAQEITFELIRTGGTGLSGLEPADVMTLASYTPASGSLIVTQTTDRRSNTEFRRISGTAVLYPLISVS